MENLASDVKVITNVKNGIDLDDLSNASSYHLTRFVDDSVDQIIQRIGVIARQTIWDFK